MCSSAKGGFVSFMEKCIDETWERSIPNGAFEPYNQNLTIILDILTAFPLESFPPVLLQKTANALQKWPLISAPTSANPLRQKPHGVRDQWNSALR